MPWFKVDDTLAFHSKTLAAGNAAMGMWVRAGSWSMATLSDGHVPNDIVKQLGGHGLARKLVDADLWIEKDNGYEFHEWNERQPSRAKVKASREANAERLRKWREAKAGETDV